MNVGAIQHISPVTVADTQLGNARPSPSNVRDIASEFMITMAGTLDHSTLPASRGSDAREAASQLVASTLILPVLQQLRESGFMSPDNPLAPTSAERRFGPLLDQEIADRITNATNFPLIDAIVEQYPADDSGSALRKDSSRQGGSIDVRA